MSLQDQFRLHYGEGKIKEKDFRLFRLGYEYGLEECIRTIKNIPSISLGGTTYEIVSQVAKAICVLKEEG